MSLKIIAGGDVVLNGPLNRPTGEESIYAHLRAADSAFANLEMPFTNNKYAAEKLIPLKADPIHAHIVSDIGIDVVNLANNHMLDFGFDGLRDTINALDGSGVAHVGGGENVSESFSPVIKEINGSRVAYIGFSTTLPNGSGAGRSRPGISGVRVFSKYVVDPVTIDESPGMAPFIETSTYEPDERILLDAVKEARAKADFVFVGVHWGIPFGWVPATQHEIATYQQPLAHKIIEAGASAIFGHHPHVVQGVEFYKNAPIFYSLGNLIFSNAIVEPGAEMRKYPAYTWKSLQSRVSDIGALGKVSWSGGALSSCSLIPITLLEDGEPVEALEGDAELLVSRLEALSAIYGTRFQLQKQGRGYEIKIIQQ